MNTDPIATNAILLIELDGTVAAGTALRISGGGTTIQGLVINRWNTGIFTQTFGGNTIRGNFVGTDPTGFLARGNQSGINASGDELIGERRRPTATWFRGIRAAAATPGSRPLEPAPSSRAT